MTFKVNLKRLREISGMTQEELSKRADLSKSTISMYERGERFPDEPTLELFADIFNVDMNTLLGKQEGSTYYLDPETARLAQAAANDPDMRLLLDAKRDLSPEDMKIIIDLATRLLNRN